MILLLAVITCIAIGVQAVRYTIAFFTGNMTFISRNARNNEYMAERRARRNH